MYNEYLQDAVPEPIEQPPENRTPAAGASGGGVLPPLARPLGGSKLGAGPPVAIAVIWFLLSDGKVLDTDLLIIIGVLLLLGI